MESDRRVFGGNFIAGGGGINCSNWKRHLKTVSKLRVGGWGSGGEIVHFRILTAPIHDLIASKCPTIPKPGQTSHRRRGENLRKFRRIKYMGTWFKRCVINFCEIYFERILAKLVCQMEANCWPTMTLLFHIFDYVASKNVRGI